MPWNGSKWVSDAEGWYSSQKPTPWRCKLCSCQVGHKGKACPQCGARKAWAADAATTPAAAPTPTSATPTATTGASVASQLAQVASLLHSAHAVPADATGPLDDPAPALEGATRADLSAKIKDLEACLRALPQSPLFAATRAHVEHEVATTKRHISELKPVGARLDSCKLALQRALSRRDQLKEAASLAGSSLAIADGEIKVISAELSALEAAMQADSATPAAPSCLDQLRTGMEAVIADMSTSPRVDSGVVTQVSSSMKQLFADLTLISAACAPPQQAAACAGVPSRLQPSSAASTACGSACSLGPLAAPATPAHPPMPAPPPVQVRHTPSVLHMLQTAQAVDTPAEHPNGDGSEDMQQG